MHSLADHALCQLSINTSLCASCTHGTGLEYSSVMAVHKKGIQMTSVHLCKKAYTYLTLPEDV